MPYFGILRWNLKKTVVIFELNMKSILWNFSKRKNSCKIKKSQIRDQKCLVWLFVNCNFEKLFAYFKSTPSNLLRCKVLYQNKNA